MHTFGRHRNYKQRQYEEVGRNQVYLTEEEEIELVKRYTVARHCLRMYILSKQKCRQWYLDLYQETQATGRSVAKLSGKFNPRVKGLSIVIEHHTGILMQSLCLGRVNPCADRAGQVVIYEMVPSEYCYSEMEKLMPRTKKLASMQAEVAEIEDTLLRSMLMAAHEIANRCSSNILSIDENDAVQEAQVFFLESIRKYDPDYRTPEGDRVKLCTYAYSRAERLVQEWILTNSRLVRVPRSKMGRILTVVKAYEILDGGDEINLLTLTEEANSIQRSKCVLTDNNTFTIKEVDELIKILMSNYVHLDQPFNRHNKMNPTTIGEMLSNDEPCVTELIQAQDKKEQLLELLQDNLEKIEFQIISLRYFHDPADKVPKALKEIGPLLVSVYGGMNYSRESIRKIEKKALAKMQGIWEIKRLW
jgi:RNA polymerase sigma factor (sigma-70 family)